MDFVLWLFLCTCKSSMLSTLCTSGVSKFSFRALWAGFHISFWALCLLFLQLFTCITHGNVLWQGLWISPSTQFCSHVLMPPKAQKFVDCHYCLRTSGTLGSMLSILARRMPKTAVWANLAGNPPIHLGPSGSTHGAEDTSVCPINPGKPFVLTVYLLYTQSTTRSMSDWPQDPVNLTVCYLMNLHAMSNCKYMPMHILEMQQCMTVSLQGQCCGSLQIWNTRNVGCVSKDEPIGAMPIMKGDAACTGDGGSSTGLSDASATRVSCPLRAL